MAQSAGVDAPLARRAEGRLRSANRAADRDPVNKWVQEGDHILKPGHHIQVDISTGYEYYK